MDEDERNLGPAPKWFGWMITILALLVIIFGMWFVYECVVIFKEIVGA